MSRWPLAPRWAAIALALLLPACDAGHPASPGADNRFSGPELAIQLPGDSTRLDFELDDGGRALQGMVQLRALIHFKDLVVRVALDDGAFWTLEDPMRPFDIPGPLADGPHRLTAYVASKATGRPEFDPAKKQFGPRSVAISTWSVNAAAAATSNEPRLVIDRRGDTATLMVAGGALAPGKLVIHWTSGERSGQVDQGWGANIKLDDGAAPFEATLTKAD